MSTLEERLRSLHQARELMQNALDGALLSEPCRVDAARALSTYPTHDDIERLLEGADAATLMQWGTALAMTRSVLKACCRIPECRSWALGVERHFPEAFFLPAIGQFRPWIPSFLDPLRPLRSMRVPVVAQGKDGDTDQ
jgi:hypothetical protein